MWALQDFGFPRRERGQHGRENVSPFRRVWMRRLADGLADRLEEGFVIEGFFEKIRHAAFQRLHRHRHISVAGDDDDGSPHAPRLELCDELEPRHSGHPDVGDNTIARGPPGIIEEGDRRVPSLAREAGGLQKEGEGCTYGVVVIDDMHQTGGGAHGSASSASGSSPLRSVKRKAAPPSGLFRALISPP